jgi:hypothetical protein
MKSYKSDLDIKEVMSKLNVKLSQVEVKGDSVEFLFASRLILKELFEKIEEVEEKEEED